VGPRAGFGGIRACGRGGYCAEGKRFACVPGRFSSATQATTVATCEACFRGFVCRDFGHVRGDAEACGSEGYCPEGSSTVTPVSTGYYLSDYGAARSEAFGQKECERGFYCSSGMRFACPPGRYGSTIKLTEAKCSGPLLGGRYSSESGRASADDGQACGGPDRFCPEGSTEPQHVQEGYYSVGGRSDETRVAEQPSEPGGYTLEGRRYLCGEGPIGRDKLSTSRRRASTLKEGSSSPAPRDALALSPGFLARPARAPRARATTRRRHRRHPSSATAVHQILSARKPAASRL